MNRTFVKTLLAATAVAAALVTAPAHAGKTLDTIKQRGQLVCGVHARGRRPGLLHARRYPFAVDPLVSRLVDRLGTLPGGRAGLVLKQHSSWTAIYSVAPLLPAPLFDVSPTSARSTATRLPAMWSGPPMIF